ncbi:MAG: hypothetical protein OXC62_03800 [Aestuariivita sp.]|nr:hypothetical protein [Aestuariivita sp.]
MAKAIFLSASVPDPKRSPKYDDTADSVAISSAVSALVHVILGRRLLVWGGHPATTPMIWFIAENIGVDYGKCVHLYQSNHFSDHFPEDNRRFQNVTYTDDIENDRDKSLTLMRQRMFKSHSFSAAVFIGGMDGILEEFDLFRQLQPNADVVPVVSTGGATIDLAERLKDHESYLEKDFDYISVFHQRLKIGFDEERNQI